MHPQAIIPFILPAHIFAGGLALVSGYLALFAAKGATLHRRSGMVFVAAMVTLSLSGALIAALTSTDISVVAGLLTLYFVTTALLTVRPRTPQSRWLDAAALLVALPGTLLAFKTAVAFWGTGRVEMGPMFVFGVMGALGMVGDIRMIHRGGIQGTRRIARHLWRMCFAMWVAAGSFFWGPPGRVPEVINIPAFLTVAVMTPVAAMLYWLWRVRVRQSFRGTVRVSAPHATALERP